jgi:LPXTG-site transpeptidase (sortase) family protein
MQENKIRKRNLIMFPLGTVGRDMVYNLVTSYLLTFVLFTRNLNAAQLSAITAIMVAARIFDALEKLGVGDWFIISVLGEDHAYVVTSTEVVLPDETESLHVEEGKDLVTLVTCTPYGVNSHRLLVRGHRVGNDPGALRILADAVRLEIPLVAMLLAIPILVVALVWVMLYTGGRIRHRRAKDRASAEFRMRRDRRLRRRGEDADENKHENKDVTREGD